jgi:NAD(P)H dehydrogenase (quinone)
MWIGGGLESAFGNGALSAVARQDLAAAAATVAAAPAAHEGKVYDLAGDPITPGDAAGRLGVTHTTISLGEYRARLLASDKLLPFQPPMLASIATSIRHGFLSNTSPDLHSLLGRPPIDPLTVAADSAASLRPAAPESR